jgi:hypothetical protein
MVLPMRRHSRRIFFDGMGILFTGIIFVSLVPAAGFAQGAKTQVAPSSDVSIKIGALGPRLLVTPLDESDPLTSQVQELVLDDVLKWITQNPPDPDPHDDGTPYEVKVRKEMESDFSKLHYPVFGHPHVLSQVWKGAVMIVCGYTLGWSDYDRANVVALFVTRHGQTRMLGVDHFVQRTDLHFEIFPGPDPASFRFLAYGFRLGKSQPRLSAALYGFDGQSLKSLWQVQDVYDGKLDLDNGVLVIRYLKEQEYIRELTYNRKPPRHKATYKPSAEGLNLESDVEIPF